MGHCSSSSPCQALMESCLSSIEKTDVRTILSSHPACRNSHCVHAPSTSGAAPVSGVRVHVHRGSMTGRVLKVLDPLFGVWKCKQDLTFESGKTGSVSHAFSSFALGGGPLPPWFTETFSPSSCRCSVPGAPPQVAPRAQATDLRARLEADDLGPDAEEERPLTQEAGADVPASFPSHVGGLAGAVGLRGVRVT